MEEVKSTMCEHYCKWLEKVNTLSIIDPADAENLEKVMEKICEGCPLNRL